jgi:hypothetical protein
VRATIVVVMLLGLLGFCVSALSVEEESNMDREVHGLRGPVKSCVTESQDQSDAGGGFAEKLDFDSKGRLVSRTSRYPGQPESSIRYTFDEHGRPLSETSLHQKATTWERVNSYDEAGRLIKITLSGGMLGDLTRTYEYDAEDRVVAIVENSKRGVARADFLYENGIKTMVKTVPPQEPGLGTATGAEMLMEAAMSGNYGLPKGGTVTVTFNEGDQPVEAKLANQDGRVHTRIVSTYDAKGQIVETRSIMEDPVAMFGVELPKERASADAARLDAMKAAVKRMIDGDRGAMSVSYKYDQQGRMIERKSSIFGSREHVQAMKYNEHGDLVSEKTEMSTDPNAVTGVSTDEVGNIVETRGEGPPPTNSESKLEYQYDSFGNWTEKTSYVKASPEEEFKRTTLTSRTITYY